MAPVRDDSPPARLAGSTKFHMRLLSMLSHGSNCGGQSLQGVAREMTQISTVCIQRKSFDWDNIRSMDVFECLMHGLMGILRK